MKKYLFIAVSLIVFGCNSSIVDDPAMLIRFSVPETSHIKLYVENSYDTIVATLVDELKEAGVYEVQLDINNLAEGIYFYTIEIKPENGTETKMVKKMLLIK